MSLTGNNILAGASGQTTGYDIDQSLRFNNADTPYLSWTPSSTATSTKICTISCWIKRGQINQERRIFTATQAGSTPRTEFTFNTNDYLVIGLNPTGGGWYQANTTALYRDPSAWYHIVWALDTSQATASNRSALYVNGEQVTDFSSNTLNDSTAVPQDSAILMGQSGMLQVVGAYANILGQSAYDGYMAEFHFVDGQKLTPASFGETNEDTNQWQAIEYEGSYGTNGFYLKFQDSSALGDDSSGNTNDFTSTNLAATDQVLDSPTNNFATLNPLDENGITLSEGNLKAVGSTSPWSEVRNTIGVSSGKWYWEVLYVSTAELEGWVAGIRSSRGALFQAHWYSGSWSTATNGHCYGLLDSGTKVSDGSSTASFTSALSANDIIGFALDLDSGTTTLEVYVNGSSVGTMYSSLQTGEHYTPAFSLADPAGSTSVGVMNLGSDSSFAGAKTAQGNTDGNGKGDFYYPPPTSYLALCSDNLPDPSIADPTEHFNAVLYTGNSTGGRDITVGMAPDLVWCKNLTGNNHSLTDSVRGVNRQLASNSTANETTHTNRVTAFNSDGFTTGDSDDTNANNDGIISWNWKAGGAPTADNSAGAGATPTAGSVKIDGSNLGSALAGTIPALRLSANTTSGFSIIIHDGTGSNGTLAHGLSQAPELVIAKPKTNSVDVWRVGSDYLTSWVKELRLNEISAENDRPAVFNSLAPTSSVVNLGTDGANNGGGPTFVTYCFHSVDGYSKVGSYTGNGNADGTFIYTGFRPAFVMTKSTSSTGNWTMLDSAREPTNVASPGRLYADLSNGESDGATYDFVSNGFKCRETGGPNNSGVTYIYLAFAESPFKTSNAR